jgi:predicted nucleic acid-binding Zn ribbon protein
MEKKEKGIKEVLDAMYQKYRMTQKMNEVKLVNAWEKITGPLISKHTTEIKLANKTLYVKFDSAPLKNEMMYRRFDLIEAINKELAMIVVEKIFIK